MVETWHRNLLKLLLFLFYFFAYVDAQQATYPWDQVKITNPTSGQRYKPGDKVVLKWDLPPGQGPLDGWWYFILWREAEDGSNSREGGSPNQLWDAELQKREYEYQIPDDAELEDSDKYHFMFANGNGPGAFSGLFTIRRSAQVVPPAPPPRPASETPVTTFFKSQPRPTPKTTTSPKQSPSPEPEKEPEKEPIKESNAPPRTTGKKEDSGNRQSQTPKAPERDSNEPTTTSTREPKPKATNTDTKSSDTPINRITEEGTEGSHPISINNDNENDEDSYEDEDGPTVDNRNKPGDNSSSASDSPRNPPPPRSSPLSPAVKAGIAIGATLILVLLILLALFLVRYRRRQQYVDSMPDTEPYIDYTSTYTNLKYPDFTIHSKYINSPLYEADTGEPPLQLVSIPRHEMEGTGRPYELPGYSELRELPAVSGRTTLSSFHISPVELEARSKRFGSECRSPVKKGLSVPSQAAFAAPKEDENGMQCQSSWSWWRLGPPTPVQTRTVTGE